MSTDPLFQPIKDQYMPFPFSLDISVAARNSCISIIIESSHGYTYKAVDRRVVKRRPWLAQQQLMQVARSKASFKPLDLTSSTMGICLTLDFPLSFNWRLLQWPRRFRKLDSCPLSRWTEPRSSRFERTPSHLSRLRSQVSTTTVSNLAKPCSKKRQSTTTDISINLHTNTTWPLPRHLGSILRCLYILSSFKLHLSNLLLGGIR